MCRRGEGVIREGGLITKPSSKTGCLLERGVNNREGGGGLNTAFTIKVNRS